MPVYRNNLVLEIARNVKAFLNLEAGITRGRVSASGQNGAVHMPARIQQRLQSKNEEISRLQKELGRQNGAAPGPATPEERPPMFFLVGRAKSGTSWLMRLLNNHPEILCRGEGKLFGKESPRSLHGALTRSAELEHWLNRNPWTWQEQDPKLEDLVSTLVHYLMAEKLSKTRKRIVGDKTPFLTANVVKEISALCPGSKVVHIIRDGRDVAISTAHHRWNNAPDQGGPIAIPDEEIAKREAYRADPSAFGSSGESIFAEGQVAELAHDWRTTVERVMQDSRKLLGDGYHQLFYEDLLDDPIGETQRLLRFLEADASEETSRHCVEAASFEKMASRKPGEEDSTSFFRKGVAGDWRGVFTKEDRQAFKEEAGETLIQLGYEKGKDW